MKAALPCCKWSTVIRPFSRRWTSTSGLLLRERTSPPKQRLDWRKTLKTRGTRGWTWDKTILVRSLQIVWLKSNERANTNFKRVQVKRMYRWVSCMDSPPWILASHRSVKLGGFPFSRLKWNRWALKTMYQFWGDVTRKATCVEITLTRRQILRRSKLEAV